MLGLIFVTNAVLPLLYLSLFLFLCSSSFFIEEPIQTYEHPNIKYIIFLFTIPTIIKQQQETKDCEQCFYSYKFLLFIIYFL